MRSIRSIMIHPKYDNTMAYFDVAVIKMNQPVPYLTNIYPVCLPVTPSRRTNKYDDKSAILIGWGVTDNRQQTSQTLREVQQTVYSTRYYSLT